MTGDEIGNTLIAAIDALIASTPTATRGQIFRALGQGLLDSGFTSGFEWFWGETVLATTGTVNVNWGSYRNAFITISAATVTIVFATAPLYTTHVQLRVKQDGSGGRNLVLPSSIKWAAGLAPSMATTANAESFLSFFYAGGTYYGMWGTDFKTS